MKGVIETARNNLDDYQVVYQINISSSKLDLCIERAKEAIRCSDTYTDITSHIFNAFNTRKRFSKRWHCIAFAGTGGESRVSNKQYCQLLFGGVLHIEIFNAK